MHTCMGWLESPKVFFLKFSEIVQTKQGVSFSSGGGFGHIRALNDSTHPYFQKESEIIKKYLFWRKLRPETLHQQIGKSQDFRGFSPPGPSGFGLGSVQITHKKPKNFMHASAYSSCGRIGLKITNLYYHKNIHGRNFLFFEKIFFSM